MTDFNDVSSRRIWMNMTTSINWTRPPVGIVRVERELFTALSAILGKKLIPCVLKDGKFVAHSGPIGLDERYDVPASEDPFVWPDPSYDFPQMASLEPVKVQPLAQKQLFKRTRAKKHQPEIQFGDVLISVGLDWDWEDKGLDVLLYKLKTQKNVKVLTCCYDLIPILFPQYCVGDVAAKFKSYFTNLTWASSGMLCISRRSEADYRALATELGMPVIPTKVMLLGNKLPENDGDISPDVESICKDRYILFVSTIERRKNHEILYKALRILAEEGRLDKDLKLVFVGMPGWGVSDFLKDLELDPLVSEHILQLNHVSDAELRHLYEFCSFFAYPSLYEGWGLPVAEALAFGKFVIASDRGSIPEVGGDLVEYVDPWNATAWARAIETYWENDELLASKENRIRRQYHSIEWHETAGAVLELIGSVCRDDESRIDLVPGYDLRSVAGLHFGSRILATGRGGVLCHGPYIPLPAGPLEVEIGIENAGEKPAPLTFKFTSHGGTIVIQKATRKAGRSSTFKFKIELEDAVEDFETVIECNDGADISINNVSITYSSSKREIELVPKTRSTTSKALSFQS